MKNEYKSPELEMLTVTKQDVITTSPTPDGEWDLPPMAW